MGKDKSKEKLPIGETLYHNDRDKLSFQKRVDIRIAELTVEKEYMQKQLNMDLYEDSDKVVVVLDCLAKLHRSGLLENDTVGHSLKQLLTAFKLSAHYQKIEKDFSTIDRNRKSKLESIENILAIDKSDHRNFECNYCGEKLIKCECDNPSLDDCDDDYLIGRMIL